MSMKPEVIRGWYRSRFSSRQRDIISLAGEGLLLALLLGISTYAWNQRHITVKNHTVVVTKTVIAAITPTPSPNPLPSSTETVTVPIDSVAPGYKLSIQAPLAWRTVDLRAEASAQDWADYNLNDLAALLRFVPEHSERSALYPAVEAVDSLNVVGTSRWVAISDDAPATAANKRAYLNWLGSVTSSSDISTWKCQGATLDGAICGGAKAKIQFVKSSDGALAGFIFLDMQTQSASYDPAVVVEMAGSVAGKPVHVSGQFRLYDALFSTLGANGAQTNPDAADYLSKVQAARNAFIAGNPPQDTLDMYGRIVTAVQSLKFTN
jgi:hypothetical protein